jgi:hypothetical protein
LKQKKNEKISYNEMQSLVEDESQSFDILVWWKEHAKEFPILSKMARDLLTPLVSTVLSESVLVIALGGLTKEETKEELD